MTRRTPHCSCWKWVATAIRCAAVVLLGLLAADGLGTRIAWGQSDRSVGQDSGTAEKIRFATFNVSLNRQRPGKLSDDLASGTSVQAQKLAAIIQEVRPDVLLLCEFDYEPSGRAIRAFHDLYLARSQEGREPLMYPHHYSAPVNTGVPTGMDLNQNGSTDDADDAFGYGKFPGQYGMLVFSRFEFDPAEVRTFQLFRWIDLPNAKLPRNPDGSSYYPAAALELLRLSSKSHWGLPLRIRGETVHLLAAHPTPPAFDGPEQRNRLRNSAEIRLWADYIDPQRSGYLKDDQGRAGGLPERAKFVIVGDLNSDPIDGDGRGILQLLEHPLVGRNPAPTSRGAVEAAGQSPQFNRHHQAPAEQDTADFSVPRGPGNLRVDYVLPSHNLRYLAGGVFWPAADELGHDLVDATDHRLVWADITLDPSDSN